MITTIYFYGINNNKFIYCSLIFSSVQVVIVTDLFNVYLFIFPTQNEDGTLWSAGNVLPAGLMTFHTTTKPIDKSWHVMGLGYNPSVSPDEIRNAAVIHFNGNMKPWLDVALNQYKHLWTKYVDTEMEFLPLCNFGL